MNLFQLNDHHEAMLANLEPKFAQVNIEALESSVLKELEVFWQFLQNSELMYFNRTKDTDDTQDEMEFGHTLYFLNNEISPSFTAILRGLKMPKSSITEAQIKADLKAIAWLTGNGTLMSFAPYAQLDPGWHIALKNYLHYFFHKSEIHSFINTPVVYTPNDTSNVKIAIIGDWGTGIYSDGSLPENPAKLVIEGVMKTNPDIIVHLGDVYYAGLDDEEQTHLLDMIPSDFKGKIFTMNSNHEMYNGANGLYEIALTSPRFSHQNNSTYFAIDLGEYRLVGLDSAYFDKSIMYMKGSLNDGSPQAQKQLDFLTAQYALGKKLILCTHHVGIKYDAAGVNHKVFDPVIQALGGENAPDYWYWGHVHNGIVYQDQLSIIQNYKTDTLGPIKNFPKLRCCGHASIPFGNGYKLHKFLEPNTPIDQVAYYAKTPLEATNPVLGQRKRVLNGFALLTISNDTLTEKFYEVKNGWDGPREAWPVSHVDNN